MPDVERVVTRQQPIAVKVPSVKRTFHAKPLFWRSRGDFGNLVVAEYSRASSPAVPELVPNDDDTGSHLEYRLTETNWDVLLQAGYPDEKVEWASIELDIWEVIGLLTTALEVNGLERLGYMIDPRIKDPLMQALERATAQDGGLKTPSSTDASSSEPTPTPSLVETAPLG